MLINELVDLFRSTQKIFFADPILHMHSMYTKILCRQVKTTKHGRVRINIVHFPIPCLIIAVPFLLHF